RAGDPDRHVEERALRAFQVEGGSAAAAARRDGPPCPDDGDRAGDEGMCRIEAPPRAVRSLAGEEREGGARRRVGGGGRLLRARRCTRERSGASAPGGDGARVP